MTYNIHSCGTMKQGSRMEEIISAITYADSDIVAIQEIEKRMFQGAFQDQCQLIAERCNLNCSFTPLIKEMEREYGIALLFKPHVQIQGTFNEPLPRLNGAEPRALLGSNVLIGNIPITILTTHLGLRPKENLLQARYISDRLQEMNAKQSTIILAGDLNAIPQSRSLRLINPILKRCRPIHIGSTFPSYFPVLSLDHIFTSTHLSHSSTRVLKTPLFKRASDHLPLVSDLQLLEDT